MKAQLINPNKLAALNKIDKHAKLLIRILTSLCNCSSNGDKRRMALAHYFNWTAQQLGEQLEQVEPEDRPDVVHFPPVETLLDPETKEGR